MTVLSAQSIPRNILTPFFPTKQIHSQSGTSYGLSCAGYDIRIAQDILLLPFVGFRLASAMERFDIPSDVIAILHDKSSLARRGVAVQNTVFEPGWRGWPTLELTNHGPRVIRLKTGQPVAQVMFHQLDRPTSQPYSGKYQDQPDRPVEAIEEKADIGMAARMAEAAWNVEEDSRPFVAMWG